MDVNIPMYGNETIPSWILENDTLRTSVSQYYNGTLSNSTLEDDVTIDITVQKIILVTLLSLIILSSIFGNCLVLIAILLERTLQTVPNYLIASLAVADLLVSTVVMPLVAVLEVTEIWIWGQEVCDFFISMDVLLCTASILNLCVIALDRYWSITKHVQYTSKRTPRRMLLMIALVWLISAIISIAPLFGWRTPDDKADPYDCRISQDLGYTVFSTFGAFYIPMVVMLIIYWRIYQVAKFRIRGKALQKSKYASDNSTVATVTTVIGNGSPSNHHQALPSPIRTLENSKRHLAEARERKAAKTLGIVTGAFVVCWLPFFIVALVLPFCKENCNVPPPLRSCINWLGYVNSLLNPIIYTVFNKEFKNAFHKILKCQYCQHRY
ncbi:5-hydroxytryptamine receptor 1A-like [Ptychodera flava]|uniref:5-hydroxytryptamine receptor 1A-like n=1 Tax=Ptychodera flava TaxID=63121 RepID=UPI00396A5CB4